MVNNQSFGKIRSIIFPIHKSELHKFLPINGIFLLVSLNYALLRILKDIFILSNTSMIVISYLKLFGVMPSIILFTIFYNKISRVVSRDSRFNIVVSYFFLFFCIACFFLMPNLKVLQLDKLADNLTAQFPTIFGLWEVIRYWPLALFYIHAEAWGTVVLSVLLWTFINEITGIKQAQRLYSFLTLGAAVGTILAGSILKCFSNDFNTVLKLVLVLSITLLLLYNLFSAAIKKNPSRYQVAKKPEKKKVKLSFIDSFKFLIQSKYLSLIFVLVLSYGLCINLFECVWKDQIRELQQIQGNIDIMAKIFGNQNILVGLINILLIIFLSAPIMRRGWRFAASVTPTIALSLTVVFFLFLYFNDSLTGLTYLLGTNPLLMAVILGLINDVLIKAFKYTLFEPTKEAVYIPLDEESRIRGKAAVDGIGSRLGKSLSAMSITFLSWAFGGAEIADIKYILFFIILFVMIAWLVAIKALSIRRQEAETTLIKE